MSIFDGLIANAMGGNSGGGGGGGSTDIFIAHMTFKQGNVSCEETPAEIGEALNARKLMFACLDAGTIYYLNFDYDNSYYDAVDDYALSFQTFVPITDYVSSLLSMGLDKYTITSDDGTWHCENYTGNFATT